MKGACDRIEPFSIALEASATRAIAACGGDAREAVKALVVANDFLEAPPWAPEEGLGRLRPGRARRGARTQG